MFKTNEYRLEKQILVANCTPKDTSHLLCPFFLVRANPRRGESFFAIDSGELLTCRRAPYDTL